MILHMMRRGIAAAGVLSIAASLWLAAPGAAAAQDAEKAQALVDKARLTVDAFRGDPNMGAMRDLVARAKAVLVVPQLLKAGFIIGGEGGSGVLLTRSDAGWSAPAFYSMAAGSIGLQIGAQASEVVLIFMTERAIDAVLHNKVKLGADASAAAGPVGVGIEAATTTNLRDDIYTYARSKGLFAGASFEGAVLSEREKFNSAYYGGPVSPAEIIMQRTVDREGANALRAALDALIAASGGTGG